VDGLWATESEGVALLSVRLVFKDFQHCDPDPPTSQTEGQTDGRRAISIPRYAEHYSASRGQNRLQLHWRYKPAVRHT